MAKKVKRQLTRITPAQTPAQPQEMEAAPLKNNSGSRYPVRSSATPTSSTEFNPDYTYVIADLKRIGILAGSFITILVVLSFFLR